MIELTADQAKALRQAQESPLAVVDPTTNTPYVLVRQDVYERLTQPYDDSPWTDEEMDRLAAEDADALGWDGMEAYQGPLP